MTVSEQDSTDSKESDSVKEKLVSPGFLICPCSGDSGAVLPGPLAAPREMQVEVRSGREETAGDKSKGIWQVAL